MLELLLCSSVTVLPDYLYRRYMQNKRWGAELNLFSVWYELRWGITACFILTVTLITLVFYYHPSTKNVIPFFRTLTILPETGGRVTDVFVRSNQRVEAGAPIFRMDDANLLATAETARLEIQEVNAAISGARADLDVAEGNLRQAEAAYEQAADELGRKKKLKDAGSAAVSASEVERLENLLAARQGAVDAAAANVQAIQSMIEVELPAKRATAEAVLDETMVALDELVVYAAESGTIEQFSLRPGDYVNPILRPAGIIVPDIPGAPRFQAGFGQVSAQVIKPGMLSEITCVSKPFTVIPMVVVSVQDVISSGQLRPSDQLVDIPERSKPGTLTVVLEPLFEGQVDSIPRGSSCIANAYTIFDEATLDGDIGAGE